MLYIKTSSFILSSIVTLALTSPAPALPPNSPASTYLGPSQQLNYSIPATLSAEANPANPPGIYIVNHAKNPTTLQIAWYFGELPQLEFNILILRALNTLVDIVTTKSMGDAPVEGDKITFRSPGCHVQAIKETRMTYGIIAGAIRGIGELAATYGAKQADIFVVVNNERVARISIERNRRP